MFQKLDLIRSFCRWSSWETLEYDAWQILTMLLLLLKLDDEEENEKTPNNW